MKKIKWTIMTLVVTLSVGAALATAPQHDCRTDTQYYISGGAYMPAGSYGFNFVCDSGSGVCTYTTDGVGNYYTCRLGAFRMIPQLAPDNKTSKTKTNKK